MARTRKSAVVVGGIGVALLAALAACSSSGSGSTASSGSSAAASGASSTKSLGTVTLVMGSKSSSMALGFIADQGGLFTKNGLNVKLVYAGTGALATAAMIANSAKFTIDGGQGLFAAQATGESGLGTQLVLTPAAAKKAGLGANATTAEKVKALNGLTIASASASSSWTAPGNKAASTEGAKIKWTYISETAMASAMKVGNIDGLVAAPPWTTQVLFNKTADLWLDGPPGSFPGGFATSSYGDPVVATKKSYADAHPAIVKAFTKSILQASQLAVSDPAKAAGYVKQVAYPTMSQAEFNQIWASTLPLLKSPQLTLASLKTTLALDGDPQLDASALYPSSILSSVN